MLFYLELSAQCVVKDMAVVYGNIYKDLRKLIEKLADKVEETANRGNSNCTANLKGDGWII